MPMVSVAPATWTVKAPGMAMTASLGPWNQIRARSPWACYGPSTLAGMTWTCVTARLSTSQCHHVMAAGAHSPVNAMRSHCGLTDMIALLLVVWVMITLGFVFIYIMDRWG